MIFPSFLGLAMSFFALAVWAGPPDTTIVFVEDGRSTEGDRQYSRFEIGADNNVLWETTGEGAFCPSIAGNFAGTVDEKVKEALSTLALTSIGEQGPTINKDETSIMTKRQSKAKIYLIQNGKTSKATISKGGTSFEEFYDTLMKVKRSLRPTKAVSMTAIRIKGDIQVKFELLGNGPFNLLFSKNRPDEFMFGPGRDAAYAAKPGRTTIHLTQKNKSYSLLLRGKFNEINQVRYSNGQVLNRADKSIPIQEVALCAEF
ncbi:MAG: hypothetical protein A2X86_02560 [Bdellovibrionales bacterium GWA2_49_15]|nr:MAG: hypothetical protein A2X86_02560 [Bdellovibrionales bacterium GWA2_49_15]HAZ14180.1 hypothetical protein [Bdellovibrionales bacterium]